MDSQTQDTETAGIRSTLIHLKSLKERKQGLIKVHSVFWPWRET